MSLTADVLREEIIQERAGKERWQCSPGLKKKIVHFAQQQSHRGSSRKALAASLGVSTEALYRWRRQTKSPIKPVAILEEAYEQSLALITPGGSRLEGLDLDSAAELIRRLER